LYQTHGIQLIEERSKEFQLPIMCHSYNINVPLRRAIKDLKKICHESIP